MPRPPGDSPAAEFGRDGVPWVPRLGGRARLGPELELIAQTGEHRGRGRSEARMAVLTAAAAGGWQLADVRAAVASGAWRGLAQLYERPSEPGRMDRLLPLEWRKTIGYLTGRKMSTTDPLATRSHAPPYPNRLWLRGTA